MSLNEIEKKRKICKTFSKSYFHFRAKWKKKLQNNNNNNNNGGAHKSTTAAAAIKAYKMRHGIERKKSLHT